MPVNPAGNFLGLDPDYDKGPINVQWSDLGNGAAAKVGVIWEARNYVWDGVSQWVRETQPAGGASITVDVSDRAGRLLGVVTSITNPVAVTGTFWQATQPVSGTFWQATQPVSGTFFQATQPVSLAAAVDISDRAVRLLGHVTVDNASLAVTGTFWQATQPVSGTFWQATQPVSGTFWQGTQPVSIAAAVDVSDRAGRLLGVVASITAAVDISDRAARLLGVVASITNPVAVTNANLDSPLSGLAKDATVVTLDTDFKSATGAAGDSPAAGTVIDTLKQIVKAIKTQDSNNQAALAKLVQKPTPPKYTTTLLHRG